MRSGGTVNELMSCKFKTNQENPVQARKKTNKSDAPESVRTSATPNEKNAMQMRE